MKTKTKKPETSSPLLRKVEILQDVLVGYIQEHGATLKAIQKLVAASGIEDAHQLHQELQARVYKHRRMLVRMKKLNKKEKQRGKKS